MKCPAEQWTWLTAHCYLEGNADAVEFCPHDGYQNVLAASTYTLKEGEQPNRVGSISLFDVNAGNLELFHRVDTAGIFDIKWSSVGSSARPLLAQADADGYLRLYSLEGCSKEEKPRDSNGSTNADYPMSLGKQTACLLCCSIHVFMLFDAWDLRSISRPVNEASVCLGGGVWRIKHHPFVSDLVLAACMHNGFAIVKIGDLKPEVVEAYNQHGSLADGADWQRAKILPGGKTKSTTVATCSYHDRLLRLWMLKSDNICCI
ncbi:hypothetical protein V6N13_060092 [Hibiscus sabdariffa]|uniref:Diphthine methyltransferase n=1 Tax=Hibiscus sabdariffa TaxID=183260 RepID=A0ABR2GB03_9ROSI